MTPFFLLVSTRLPPESPSDLPGIDLRVEKVPYVGEAPIIEVLIPFMAQIAAQGKFFRCVQQGNHITAQIHDWADKNNVAISNCDWAMLDGAVEVLYQTYQTYSGKPISSAWADLPIWRDRVLHNLYLEWERKGWPARVDEGTNEDADDAPT